MTGLGTLVPNQRTQLREEDFCLSGFLQGLRLLLFPKTPKQSTAVESASPRPLLEASGYMRIALSSVREETPEYMPPHTWGQSPITGSYPKGTGLLWLAVVS